MFAALAAKLTSPKMVPVDALLTPNFPDITSELNQLEADEYKRVITKLNLQELMKMAYPPTTNPTGREIFLRWMKEKGYGYYEGAKVRAFLERQAVHLLWETNRRNRKAGREKIYRMEHVWIRLSAYNKPIPLPVLHLVEEIHGELKVPMHAFEVSDFKEVQRPDPFLRMLLLDTTGAFVIAKWDEPSFKGKMVKP